jgi:hypothetical protein
MDCRERFYALAKPFQNADGAFSTELTLVPPPVIAKEHHDATKLSATKTKTPWKKTKNSKSPPANNITRCIYLFPI